MPRSRATQNRLPPLGSKADCSRAVDVGRFPLHAAGALPEAVKYSGLLPHRLWVLPDSRTVNPGVWKTKLAASGRLKGAERSLIDVRVSTHVLEAAVAGCGGELIIALSRLLALCKGGGRSQARVADELARQRGCTLTASRACVVVRAGLDGEGGKLEVRVLSAQDWATVLGVPVGETYIRDGLRAVSQSQGRAIMGQAVHFKVMRAFLQEVLKHARSGGADSGQSRVTYVSLFSGIDVGAAAMESIFEGDWRFALAAEIVGSVRTALLAAWGSRMEVCVDNALGAAARRELWLLRGQVDVCFISWRCAPWSSANTIPLKAPSRREALLRAVEEMQEVVRVALLAAPRTVLIECVAGLLLRRFRRYWGWLSGFLLLQREWAWSWQVADPATLFGGAWPRRRLWIVGLKRWGGT